MNPRTPAARVGETVEITAVRLPGYGGQIGKTGTVVQVRQSLIEGGHTYVVEVGGRGGLRVVATGVRLVPYAAEPAPEVVLPMANLQAATFAHQLLGPSADLDKLIGVAEFAMDRRTVPGVLTELVAEAAAPAVEASSEDLVITDRDGDKFTVSHYGTHGTLAKVYVRNAGRGEQFAVYLTEADVDAVITRLQAFKAEGFTPSF